jgi:WD40 repeat protein
MSVLETCRRPSLPALDGDGWVTFAPDGKTVLLGGPKGVRRWDPETGKLIRPFDAPYSVAVGFTTPNTRFTPDGKVLVSHTRRARVRWDAATGRPPFPASHETGHTGQVMALGSRPTARGSRSSAWSPGRGSGTRRADGNWRSCRRGPGRPVRH